MRRILKMLPHRRGDDTSEKRKSSQPEPIKAASLRTPTVFYDADADNNDSTEPMITASNGRPKTAQPKDDKRQSQFRDDAKRHTWSQDDSKRYSQPTDDAHYTRTSTLNEPNERKSGLVSYDKPVDTAFIHRSDTNKSKTKASDHGLQLGPQGTSLYDDLSYLTLGGDTRDAVDPSRKQYSEDVADRNVMLNEKGRLTENTAGRRASLIHVPTQIDEFSEDIADRNLDSPPRSSTSNTQFYPLETQDGMNRRIATLPFASDEFYDPYFEKHSASSNPLLYPLLRRKQG